MTYQQIPRHWYHSSEPDKFLYTKEFVGPKDCNPKNNVAKCISNVDVKEELKVKARLILTIREMLETFEANNLEYLEYYGEACKWYQFKCKKERKRKPIQ